MPEFGKPAIIIPAFNEEDWIGRTIDLVKATGIDARIIVVDDGSTDRTAMVAERKGCEIVRMQKNVGKAGAFFKGLKIALQSKPLAIVTADADMLEVPGNSLHNLIQKASKETIEGRNSMIVADTFEGHSRPKTLCFSGIRAFSIQAGFSLKNSKVKSLAKGFSLELFLNSFFGGSMNISSQKIQKIEQAGFVQREAFKNESQRKKQGTDFIHFSQRRGPERIIEKVFGIKPPSKSRKHLHA